MIVKCQRALESNEFDPPVLVYDRTRDFEVHVPMGALWEDLFSVYGLEQYFGAKFFARVHMQGSELVIDKVFKQDLGW